MSIPHHQPGGPENPSDNPKRLCIHQESVEEANRYKWIESEKAGCDLGQAASRRWVVENWTSFLRARWIEHLRGDRFWIEFDSEDFGFFQREFLDQQDLVDEILDQLKDGKENLHVILWASGRGIPIEPVRQILTALDLHSLQLHRRFDRLDW
jgi:hypothetical protein